MSVQFSRDLINIWHSSWERLRNAWRISSVIAWSYTTTKIATTNITATVARDQWNVYLYVPSFVLYEISPTSTHRRIHADYLQNVNCCTFQMISILPPIATSKVQRLVNPFTPVMRYNNWAVVAQPNHSPPEQTEKLVCRIPGIIISYHWQTGWPCSWA